MTFLIKTAATLLLLGCVSASLAQATKGPRKFKHNSKVETRIEGDRKTIYLRPMLVRQKDSKIEAQFLGEARTRFLPAELLYMSAYFVARNASTDRPAEIVIAFRSTSMDKTLYADTPTLSVTLDGSVSNLGVMQVLERRVDDRAYLGSNQYMLESLEIAVPYDSFMRLTNATKVQAKLGSTTFEISKEHLEAFRDLISRTE